jgi:DNA (cytosine-5)-methyltransferase 1
MVMLDLFSGIGGFSLAASWCGIETVCFVEIDPFCQTVLNKHWPSVPIINDIRGVTSEQIIKITKSFRCSHRKDGKEKSEIRRFGESISRNKNWFCNESPIDILTGGFPCQPFSVAGKRKGTDDNRFLWPEMLRVIREIKPTWVIAENVGGILTIDNGMVFENCCTDLEKEGYEVQSLVIPACAVNAPHRRDRVWIIACNSKYDGRDGTKDRQGGFEGSNRNEGRSNENGEFARPTLSRDIACSNPNRLNGDDAGFCSGEISQQQEAEICGCDASNAEIARQLPEQKFSRTGDESWCNIGADCWNENWPEVAARLCRVDDGLPRKLDRVNRLRALGNSIVPQVAYQIFRAILEVEHGR